MCACPGTPNMTGIGDVVENWMPQTFKRGYAVAHGMDRGRTTFARAVARGFSMRHLRPDGN